MDGRRAGKPVLVGVDGSSSLEAVRWAAREAARRQAPLQLVHAAGPFTLPHEYGELVVDARLHELADRHGRAVLAEAVAVAAEAAPEVEIRHEVHPGYPIAWLTAESRDAQLLVLGSHEPDGGRGLPADSVAAALAAHAACPVVVIRAPQVATGGRAAGSSGPVRTGGG